MNAHPGLERYVNWLLNHSLQAGVLVLLVLAVQWLFRRRLTNRWRFALWWVVLARMLLPFSPQSVVSVFNYFQPAVQIEGPRHYLPMSPPVAAQENPVPVPTPAVSAQQTEPPQIENRPAPALAAQTLPLNNLPAAVAVSLRHSMSFDDLLIPGLICGWLAGVLILSGVVAVQLVRFYRKIARAVAPADTGLRSLLDDCRREFGVVRRVELFETSAVQSPALFGLLRLRLLVPPGFGGQFSRSELRYIFLHELAHVKRGDLWLNWLVTALQILHWFNPLLWLGFARLRADRELACDELALLRAGDNVGTAYGETVVKLLENLGRPAAIPGLVGILEDKKQMRRRILMIANFRRPGRWSVLAIFLIAGVAAAALTDAQTKAGRLNKNEPATATASQTAQPSREVVTNGPAMEVTVLDAETGQPLENAAVFAPNEAAFFKGKENAPRWFTDKTGIAVIRLGESSTNAIGQSTWFTLSARKEGYAPLGMSWAAESKDVRPEMPKAVTIRLKRGTTIGGAVYDDTGAPQAGMQVRVFGSGYGYNHGQDRHQEYPEFWNDSFGAELPTTDASGHWELKDFPLDLPNVAIEFVRADGSVEKFKHLVREINPFNDPEGQPVDMTNLLAGKARFELKPGQELHGRVVNEHGQPLPGVRIQIGYGMVNLVHAGEVQADADGNFVLSHLNHRQVILTADAAGYAITSQIVDLSSNQTDLHLQMGEMAPLHIQVLDKNGSAIAGAKVATETYRTEGQLLDFSGVTDGQGGLIWSNAPVSSFALTAILPADPGLRQKIRTTPEQRAVTFHLREGWDKSIIIDGRVRDAKTGAPVKLESVKYQTADREKFRWDAEVSDAGFHLELPASRFRPGMYPSYQLQLKAAGYGTLTTEWRDYDEGDWNASLALQPADVSGGTVTRPDGTPAAGAILWTRSEEVNGSLYIAGHGHDYGDGLIKVQIDDKGAFNLPEVRDDQPVVITDTGGFLSTSAAEVRRNPNVRLQPWGRVAGVLKIGGKPKGGVPVDLSTLQWFPKMGFHLIYTTSTAPDGSFDFEEVPPGEYKLYRDWVKTGVAVEDHPLPLVVKPGEVANIDYSNPGRQIIGQAVADRPELAVDWLHDQNTLSLKQPSLDTAVNPKDYASQKDFQEAYNNSFVSPERMKQVREARTYALTFEQDGSFRADDVPPGTYELAIKVTKPDSGNRFSPFDHPENELGSFTSEVVVPSGNTPLDLGTLTVAMKGGGGDQRPVPVDFSARTLDGQAVSMAQYKGKYVVLAFWAAWSERSVEGLGEMQKLQTSLNQDPRVVFLGVNVDNNPAAAAKAVAEHSYHWTQATVDPKNTAKLMDDFNISSLPEICLIDTDGRIIVRDLSGDRLAAAVQRALLKK